MTEIEERGERSLHRKILQRIDYLKILSDSLNNHTKKCNMAKVLSISNLCGREFTLTNELITNARRTSLVSEEKIQEYDTELDKLYNLHKQISEDAYKCNCKREE